MNSAMAIVENSDALKAALSQPVQSVVQMQQAFSLFRGHGITVLSPAITGIMPGYAIGLSVIEMEEADLYPVPGSDNVALGKNGLNRVAAAAGVSWHPSLSGRVDNGSEPLYCHYRAVAVVIGTDGQPRQFAGEKAIDLRPGSAQVATVVRNGLKWQAGNYTPGIFNEAEICCREPDLENPAAIKRWRRLVAEYNARIWCMPKNQRPTHNGRAKLLKDPFGQIDEIAAFILPHAETKAKNRALRHGLSLPVAGPRNRMTGFLVAKPYFNGQFDDPVMRREAARAITAHALGASALLFGGGQQPAIASTSAEPPPLEYDDAVEPIDDSWDMPPSGTDPDDPGVTFDAIPNRGLRMGEVLKLAKQKGMEGDGEGKVNWAMMATWDRETLRRAYCKLVEMADLPNQPEQEDTVGGTEDLGAPPDQTGPEPKPSKWSVPDDLEDDPIPF